MNFYYVSEILGKAIAPSGSYKTIRSIREGNDSTIKNLTSLGNTFSHYKIISLVTCLRATVSLKLLISILHYKIVLVS